MGELTELKISQRKRVKIERDAKANFNTGAMWEDVKNSSLKMNAQELDLWLSVYSNIKHGRVAS